MYDSVSGAVSRPIAILPVTLVIALAMPRITSSSALYVWSTAAIWALFALGTNILFGWSGMLSFGQAAFFGIGAYTVALLSPRGLSPLVLVLGGAAVAATVGAVFAVIALRTSGVEFAVLTLVLAQVLWLLTYHVPALKGDDGFSNLSGGEVFGISLRTDEAFWYFAMAVVGLCAFGLRRLELSSLGAALRAVRDDGLRAASLGLSVNRLKILAFSLAAGIGGVAGALLARHQGVATPQLLYFNVSGDVLVACLIGGTVFWGPVVGAVVLIVAQNFLFGSTGSPSLLTGLLLLVIVMAMPGGLTSLPAFAADLRRGSLGRFLATYGRRGSADAEAEHANVAVADGDG
jgi:branched-chain amino acid transport system permease protein